MIDTLYIHAGLHKTGSSSIQRFLRINEASLASQYDIHTPAIRGALQITPELKDYKVNSRAFDVLKGLEHSICVISKENFAWIDRVDALLSLRDRLRRYARQTKVVIYLRRQDSLAVSQKQEGTKWLDCAIAYGHEPKALPSELSYAAGAYLDFETRIGMWGDVFGDENLILRVFESERFPGGDVVRDFASILGVSADSLQLPSKVNESLSRETQLFLHQTRQYFPERSLHKDLLVRGARLVDSRSRAGRRKLLPTRQEAEKFYERFKVGNRVLNERFKLSPIPTIFFEDFSVYSSASDERPLSEAELKSFFRNVIEALDSDPKTVEHPTISARALTAAAEALPNSYAELRFALLRIAVRLQPRKLTVRYRLLCVRVEQWRQRRRRSGVEGGNTPTDAGD